LLDFFVFVFKLALQDVDARFELTDFHLVEILLGLATDLCKLLVPLNLHYLDFLLQQLSALF
jgi:hypothetical protein